MNVLIRCRLAGLSLGLLLVLSRPAGAAEYRVATFEADITIPVGHACMGGGIADAKVVLDPLYAKGFVFLGAGDPVVVVALDWCQANNRSYDRWREALAEAAGTVPTRVMLATVHQHDAPISDLRAQELLDEVGLKGSICDPAFHEQAVHKTAAALRTALASPRRVTHVGVGQAAVERVASNRRIATDALVHWDRTSSDTRFDAAPEGEADHFLKSISLWDGEQPVLAPGDDFEYTSFCPLPTSMGTMHGAYTMRTRSGETFEAEIAPFTLAVPGVVN